MARAGMQGIEQLHAVREQESGERPDWLSHNNPESCETYPTAREQHQSLPESAHDPITSHNPLTAVIPPFHIVTLEAKHHHAFWQEQITSKPRQGNLLKSICSTLGAVISVTYSFLFN